ncbi:hypothetical protein ALC152_04990 [Arcobacter sp. 15-2]|uniref:hypothetical protein n=1 Tax=Arcobacter sp. 15-2 TaxID=3374109 RepID=UPI00399CC782
MKQLLKLSLISIALATALNAKTVNELEYSYYSNVYNPDFIITKDTKKKEVFFGTREEYMSSMSSALNNGAVDGAINALQNQAGNIAKGFLSNAGKAMSAGAVIGGVFGYIDGKIKDSYYTREFMYVVEFTNPDGTMTTGSVLFIATDKEKYNDDSMNKIKEIVKGGF